MDVLIENRDIKVNALGLPIEIFDHEEELQKAKNLIGMPLSSMPYAKHLGSKIYEVQENDEYAMEKLLSFASLALKNIEGLDVIGVTKDEQYYYFMIKTAFSQGEIKVLKNI